MTNSLRTFCILLAFVIGSISSTLTYAADTVKETIVKSDSGVLLKIRMEGPYTADVPLQVVCYFKYSAAGVQKMKGAPVELDKHLNGIIGALRERGEFVGNRLETILINAPKDSIKAGHLLLIGLGSEDELSLELMEQVGATALRTAASLGLKRVAFAPLLRDQGNDKLATGAVETAVVRGALLAYDTQSRMHKQQLANSYTLEEWWIEAGPAYYDETVAEVEKAVAETSQAIKTRLSTPYATKKN